MTELEEEEEEGERKGKGRIHLGVAWTSDPSSQQRLGHLVFFPRQTCQNELAELTRQ